MAYFSPFSTRPSTLLFVVATAMLLVQLILAVGFVSRRAKGGKRWDALVIWLCVGTPLAIIGLTILGVYAGRVEVIWAWEPVDPSEKAGVLSGCNGLCASQLQTYWGGWLLAAAGLFGAACASAYWRSTRSSGPDRSMLLIAASGAGVVLLIFGGGIAAYVITLGDNLRAIGMAFDIATRLSMLHGATSGAVFVLKSALAASIVAVLGTGALILRIGGKADPSGVSNRVLSVCVAIFIIGSAAFALTRGHATDTARPLRERAGSLVWPHERDIALPELVNARPLGRAVIVTVTRSEREPSRGVVSYEGMEVATVRELVEDTGDPWSPIASLEQALGRRRALGERADADVVLIADRSTPLRAIAPILVSMRAAGYGRIQLGTCRTESVTSSVLGELRSKIVYAVSIDLSDAGQGGVALDLDDSYSDLAEIADLAAAKGDLRVRVDR